MGITLPVNKNAFDIDTEAGAYFIGFLLADGSMYSRDGNIRLQVSEKDSFIVEKLKDYAVPNHKITHRNAVDFVYGGNKIGHSKSTVGICLPRDPFGILLSRYGIVPRKSGKEKAHDSLVNNRDFWRGYFDGDGSLYPTGNTHKAAANLVGGITLLQQFALFMGTSHKIRWNNGTGSLQIYGETALQVARVLYKEATISLPRKQAIADAWMEGRIWRVDGAWVNIYDRQPND